MSELPPKEILAQRYRLIEQIGEGGMGSVWRAEHTSLRTPVAVKLLKSRLANNATVRARFLREAQAAAVLNSVNIVRILDHGVDDDIPYIAMEFLTGESLRARLKRERTLSPAATAKIFVGVARGVARAHQARIVHRDLKPDNIFITQDDDHGQIVKVVDFGIAKLLDETKLPEGDGQENIATATGAMLGTPYYMSPEQLRGKKQIDARSDLWALGVIAFECLTGKRPFVADAIGELILKICSDPAPVPSSLASVPDGFDDWFARAATADPEKRFQTIQELSKALAEILAPNESWLPSEPDPGGPSPDNSRPSLTPRATPLSSTPQPVRSGGVATATTVIASDLQSATGGAHSLSSAPGEKRRLRPIWAAGIAVALAAGGGLVYTLGGGPASNVSASAGAGQTAQPAATPGLMVSGAAEPMGSLRASSSASSSAVDAPVAITFETTPSGLEVVRDGKSLGDATAPFTFERGSEEITLTFRKKGFISREVKLTPDRSKSIKVELVRAARPSDVLE